jgi:O-antigen biosynthesis protein WbqP
VKRVFDLLVALAATVPAFVVCLAVMPFVWIECRASPIFLQARVGKDQRPFRILKLRTMRANTASVASHEVNAAQITRSGSILRRLKIDELPQIWNVLIGEMSFVGPRPCLPSQIELINAREAKGVFALRPGISGVAQIAGIDMSTPSLLAERDAAYLGPWSLARDLNILIRTVTGAGSGDAAVVPRI